jgi:hypothetical protein
MAGKGGLGSENAGGSTDISEGCPSTFAASNVSAQRTSWEADGVVGSRDSRFGVRPAGVIGRVPLIAPLCSRV